jgi:hypothetical protein
MADQLTSEPTMQDDMPGPEAMAADVPGDMDDPKDSNQDATGAPTNPDKEKNITFGGQQNDFDLEAMRGDPKAEH